MRKRSSVKPLLKTCPGREDGGSGNSSAEGDSATDDDDVDSDMIVLSDDGGEAGEAELTMNESVFNESVINETESPRGQGKRDGSLSIHPASGFVRAGDLPASSPASSVGDDTPSTKTSTSVTQLQPATSHGQDRFALKSNVVSLDSKSAARKSKKRKLKPSEEDGRKQTSISSFFGPSTTKGKKDETVGVGSSSVDDAAVLSQSSSSSSLVKSSQSQSSLSSQSSQSREIKVSTLDGFVSVSPRKEEKTNPHSLSSSSRISVTDSQSSSSTSSSTSALFPQAKRQRRNLEPNPGSSSCSFSPSSTASTSVGFGSSHRGKVGLSSNRGGAASGGEHQSPRIDDLPDEILETIFCQIPHGGMSLDVDLLMRGFESSLQRYAGLSICNLSSLRR